jgi:protein TonB
MAAEVPRAPVFAAFQRVSQEAGLVRRRRSVTVGISLGVHSLLLVVAATAGAFSRVAPAPAPPPERRVVVKLGRPAPPRPAPAPPPEAPKPPPRKPPRPVMALVQPDVERNAIPPVEAEAPVEETDDAGVDENAPDHGGPVGRPDGVATAVPPPPAPAPPPPPPGLTAEQRRQQLARYLEQALRPRFLSRFEYPAEARETNAEGRVMLRLTIDCSGRLLAATTSACPAEILCEHAERTIRDASPFPPPPAELGSTIQVDMPIAYRLD